LFICHATSLEKFEIYEKFKTREIFPKEFSPIGALSFNQHVEKSNPFPNLSRVGGFSFNPRESGGFLTFQFLGNPYLVGLINSVNFEGLIVYLIENKFKNDEEMLESLAKNREFYLEQHSVIFPMILPTMNLLEYPVYAMDLSEDSVAFSGSVSIVKDFEINHRFVKFEDLLMESVKKEKTLKLWYEHDENGNPFCLKPSFCGELYKKLKVIQNYNQILMEIIAKIPIEVS
jgi:hypothetical protein